MTVLALDAASQSCGVAIVRDGRLLAAHALILDKRHAETLMPMAAQALDGAGVAMGEVDIWAAVVGPGSFTGIRQGVTCARALAHATGKPCLGIGALEALAFAAPGGMVAALIDAKHGLVYAGIYEGGRAVQKEAAVPISEFIETLPESGPITFVGDGASAHRETIEEALGSRALFGGALHDHVNPAAAALLAWERREEAHDVELLRPNYMRLSSAERVKAGDPA